MARSELESSMKSVKYILLIITSMFIVVSILMMILGVSVYSTYHELDLPLEGARGFLAPSVLMTLTGAVMTAVTLVGFVGCLKESTCLVNIYALVLGGLLVVQVAVIALGFAADEDDILRYVSIPLAQYPSDREIQQDIDFMQSSLKCCGSDSFLDYAGMEFAPDQHTVLANLTDASLRVPQTCCYKYVQGAEHGYCEAVWASGCRGAVVGVVLQNAGVLGVLAMSVAFIQLLGVIFSVLLARTIRKVKSERAYLRWKVMEQIIISRQENKHNGKPFVYIQRANSTKA